MKKFAIAAILASSLSVPAFAADEGVVLGPPQFQSYSSRGRCESALAAERNSQRRNPETRGQGYQEMSGSEFNRASRTTTRCERRNGQWVVVFYQNGF